MFITKSLKMAGKVAWYVVSNECEKTGTVTRSVGLTQSAVPTDLDTEHPMDVSLPRTNVMPL